MLVFANSKQWLYYYIGSVWTIRSLVNSTNVHKSLAPMIFINGFNIPSPYLFETL